MVSPSQSGEAVRTAGARLLLRLVFAGAILVAGCQRSGDESGGFPVASTADCLPAITLVDQDGREISLATLKGTPVLFDFIYTRCPGPCVTLTAQMNAVAHRLGDKLGTQVRFVSISVDPDHDRPPQLLEYARGQGAVRNGWLFLTGTPEQIEQLMAHFNLRRQCHPDGTIDHVLEFFLVAPDGRPLLQYLAARADPAKIARDLERAAAGGRIVGSAGADGSRHEARIAA
jgi:cytochrome oxidase Cu insertion factor (SCO1/SenC/PrrC family)